MKPIRLLLAVLLIAVVIGALAQEQVANEPKPVEQQTGPPVSVIKVPPPPLDPDAFRVSSDVELVLLDVSVKDPDGGFVSGLTKSDFKVFEDKVEQKITAFTAQDTPVTVGLVVDNSGSVRPKKPEIVIAALTFVTQSNPQDEMFVVNFNDRVLMGLPDDVPFTSNRNLLRQALLNNPSQGRTALYDGLIAALDQLHKGRLAKKTLVLISDGGDNASDVTHDNLMKAAQESLATIYTVGIFDENDKDRNPGFLKDLAHVTGGEAFIPRNAEHLVGVCEKIAKDIRNRYTIGYVPMNRDYNGKARRLRVVATSAEGKKYVVRTRTHYLAPVRISSRTREGQK
jgi:VWFA-related protein